MSFLSTYLDSPAMAQQVLATGDGTTPDEVKFATEQLTYAALRWHQLFENDWVDAQRINLQPLEHSDFLLYLEAAANVLKKPCLDAAKFREHVNDLVRAASFKAFGLSPEQILQPTVSQDYHQRLVTLLTMAACQFTFVPAKVTAGQPQLLITPYFREPQTLTKQITNQLRNLAKWGPEKTVQTLLHGAYYPLYPTTGTTAVDQRDAEIITLPTAHSISEQINRSLANAQALRGQR